MVESDKRDLPPYGDEAIQMLDVGTLLQPDTVDLCGFSLEWLLAQDAGLATQ